MVGVHICQAGESKLETQLKNDQMNDVKVVRKPKEHPTFRSVANAIRTGIFIEKIYRRMSKSQLMVIPQALNSYLDVSCSNLITHKMPYVEFLNYLISFRRWITGTLTCSVLHEQRRAVL